MKFTLAGRGPKLLILEPTRELAIQVFEELKSLIIPNKDDFRPAVFYGKSDRETNIRLLNNGLDVVVGTPGRIKELMSSDHFKLDGIQTICLDEADELLSKGF